MVERVNYVGQKVGNYRLVQFLGKGGFAEVYLGMHVHLNTQVAVKLLLTRLASEDVEDFRREAQMIARLMHPNIVRVLDFGVEGEVPYLAMDYAPNGTLRQRHAKGSRVPVEMVVTYVKQVAEALQHAHDQRLVHRDVKPENMLLGRGNEVLLSDFGIALAAQSSQYQSTQNVAGTIGYMAPEQIQAHPRPASDQYSLGVVVYEWLSGNRPFQGSFTEIAVKHTLAQPQPLRMQVPQLSPAVEEVVMIALAKDPYKRFASMRAFAYALERAYVEGISPHTVLMTARSAGPELMPPDPGLPTSNRSVTEVATQMMPYNSVVAQREAGEQSGSTSKPYMQVPSYPPGSQGNLAAMHTFMPGQAQWVPAGNSGMRPSEGQPDPYGNDPRGTIVGMYQHYGNATQVGKEQQQKRFSRRTVVAGMVGLVAASSGLTWFVVSRQAPATAGTSISATAAKSGIPTVVRNADGTYTFPTPANEVPPLLTYTGHQDYVWSVDWSPDGQNIVSGSKDGTAHVWNASSGKRLLSYRSRITPAQDNDWAYCVRWARDSKRIAVGFFDGTVQIVDTGSIQEVSRLSNTKTSVNAMGWSPDGRYIAFGGFEGQVWVYEVATGNNVATFTGHTDTVWSLAWSPDGKRIVSGAGDNTARVWDALSGKELLIYKQHTGDVKAISWSHDGTRIVSGSWDGVVQVWDAEGGHTQLTYSKHTGGLINAVAWSHNDTYVASGGNDVHTHVWEAKSANLVSAFYTFPIYGVTWAADDKRIAAAGYNKTVMVWKVS